MNLFDKNLLKTGSTYFSLVPQTHSNEWVFLLGFMMLHYAYCSSEKP